MLSGVVCPEVPQIPHGKANSSNGEFGDAVAITCEAGFFFRSDRSVTDVITCLHTAQWDHQPTGCQSGPN